jgi:hypothetical protein
MERALNFLAGAGLGAGLMYLLDPDVGRRRRALARDKALRLTHEAEKAATVVAKDMRNRAQGLAAGDLSVLAGGRRAVKDPWHGSWSPSARALMTMGGVGLFWVGLTRTAPTACILGTAGLALIAEGISNADLSDLAHLPHNAAHLAKNAASRIAGGLGSKARHNGRMRAEPEVLTA